MENSLSKLAELLRSKNTLDGEISSIVGRPALIGHVGEFIASKIFDIELYESSIHKGSDGIFRSGKLVGKTVNIKWYAKHHNILDMKVDAVPDYYLVLTGPRSTTSTSRGGTRPWLIDSVFLFEASEIMQKTKAKIGVATSISSGVWQSAKLYPENSNSLIELGDDQRKQLRMFSVNVDENHIRGNAMKRGEKI